ncbi:MAG: tRNA lysidine(34) synthetase TilS, partial [Alicyclobacillaceae bacterium]|nr:tRNA lysidine(34) synthetase TilS [Alicyclobacillaceae bacterium]
LQRRVLTLILYYPSGRAPEWSASHIEAIRRLALTGRTGSQLDLGGGWQARRGYGELVITWNGRGGSPEERECGPAGEVPLVIPGSTLCPSLGVTIDATFVSPCEKEVWETSEVGKASGVKPSTPGVVYFDWGKMEGRPLFIRTRRPGDRFEPFGLGGTKKLKEVWIDDKVPRHLRDRWPLVTDGSHILWIVGWRRSGFWPLDEDTEVALRLEVTWWDSEIRGWLDRRFGVGK